MPVVSTLSRAGRGRGLDLTDALVDVPGRVGVRHVPGDDREALLGRTFTPAKAADNAWERPIALAVRPLTECPPDDPHWITCSRLWIIWSAVGMTRALAE